MEIITNGAENIMISLRNALTKKVCLKKKKKIILIKFIFFFIVF